jgi:uncharacterized protein
MKIFPGKSEYHITEHHLFDRMGKHILFNVGTMLFYEVTSLVCDIIRLLEKDGAADPVRALKDKYPVWEIRQSLKYLKGEKFFTERQEEIPAAPSVIKRYGIRHLELMVTHNCNMRCRYCYGSHGKEEWEAQPYLYGGTGKGMSLEMVKKGVDFLFDNSPMQKDLSLIFFGGEPLLEFKLIKNTVPYVREKEAETGKKTNLSMVTNGILLSDEVVDFLMSNKIGCQVSIDGPKEIHNINRVLPTGKGSYDLVLPGIKRLIAARPHKVSARVTIPRGMVDIPSVLDHLLSLGFGSVHTEPSVAGAGDLMVTGDDISEIKRQIESVALFLVDSVRKNRYFSYTNLVKFIRMTRVVRERIPFFCGAFRTYFALSQDGGFYPCHRFVGMEEYRMGDIDNGLDLSLQEKILDLAVDNRPACRDCWARYFCGGGCWHHALMVNKSLETPCGASCELIKHQIECAMAINSELNISDKDILSDIYEETTEPYLVADKKGG